MSSSAPDHQHRPGTDLRLGDPLYRAIDSSGATIDFLLSARSFLIYAPDAADIGLYST
jgi:hypothetical protein